MKIIYSCQAIADLKRLREFIACKNPSVAAAVAKKLQQAIKRLVDFPMLGMQVKHKNPATLRDLITDKYIIRYALLNDEIHVLRIWHGKENFLQKNF